MRLHALLITISSITILSLNGCGGGSSSDVVAIIPENPNPTVIPVPTNIPEPDIKNTEVIITDAYQVESLGINTIINTKVSLGNTPKNLYLVLSNYAITPGNSNITHNAKIINIEHSKLVLPTPLIKESAILRTPQYVQDFSSHIDTFLSKTQTSQPETKILDRTKQYKDVEGNRRSFCTNINNLGNCNQTTNATARKVISNIATNFGSKTLNIWVSDDSLTVDQAVPNLNV